MITLTLRRNAAVGLLATLSGLLAIAGCQTQSPRRSAPADEVAATQPAEPQPVDAMAGSDADRAADKVRRNQREAGGQRRPHAPRPARVVDQPRPALRP
ncbi:MAG: hypothetical protein D6744_08585 [Planctomycetota bacterium]|nr:MAG: hypothetical protein D6744_08585 [Planctomycetota bacterium]